MIEPLSPAQAAAVGRWWAQQDQKTIAAAWYAAGFTTIYSCMGWDELKRRMAEVAHVLGRSIITRYRLQA